LTEIRAELRLKNDEFIKALERKGYNQSQLARVIGIANSVICDIVCLRHFPVENSEQELKISIALESDYETLFRPYEDVVKFKKRGHIPSKHVALLPIDRVLEAREKFIELETPKINTEDFESDLKKAFDKSGVGNRGKVILSKYYGLFGFQKTSLTDLAVMYGLSRERVNQIRKKAELRLRSNAEGILKDYLGETFE
jgi:transcriptional regulator with XRE-family HTH domain